MSEEVDMNPVGGEHVYFEDVVKRCLPKCRPAHRIGNVKHSDKGEFELFDDDIEGIAKLWCPIDETTGKPVEDNYIVGADISFGTGASNSTITVTNKTTGEKVAEFASSKIMPQKWAELAIAVCEMFHSAKLIWERNGPGRIFGMRIKELEYGNIYYQTNLDTGKVSDIAGWQSGKEEKKLLLDSYRSALHNGDFKNFSKIALEECLSYIADANGELNHVKSKASQDPTGARENHGDRVISDSLANWIMKTSIDFSEEKEREVPSNSLAGRMEEYNRKAREAQQERW